jgi:glycosyltransferase involved in cell wall biosynthesis
MTAASATASVTAIVPTSGRRPTLAAAVASALAQRHCDVAVTVVGDGTTIDAIRATLGPLADDDRVTVRILPASVRGANAARNLGARSARTEWIAFLDDDDTWHPDKLARTLAAAPSGERKVIMSHRFVARTRERDYVWPRLMPDSSVHLSEYLFCRQGFFDGDGHLQTSALVTRRDLVLETPFREDLARHQDHDWVLRCVYESGAAVRMVPDVLSVYVMSTPGDPAIGGQGRWRERWEWASTNRHLFSARGYAGFLTSYGVFAAAADGDRKAAWFLVCEACRDGRPRLRDLVIAAALATIPPAARRRVRAQLTRRGATSDSAR